MQGGDKAPESKVAIPVIIGEPAVDFFDLGGVSGGRIGVGGGRVKATYMVVSELVRVPSFFASVVKGLGSAELRFPVVPDHRRRALSIGGMYWLAYSDATRCNHGAD